MGDFTPGPWTLTTVPILDGQGCCHKIGPFPSSTSFRPETHACIYADGIRIGIDESLPVARELLANARLIAACPTMYEFIKQLADIGDADAKTIIASIGID